ncbi:ABC transporter ATP-binding protein [Dongia soli]|uniref:ABC transporter ATP-binding protein n=1 Tax=Dongia soli TaxID=600628 RepID=A0ABU5EDI2_9PROT|nr:ABC transporter ATP-binding protein [Dongia soli]MDY0884357.1 ABC transporter ATP-binding protein [Dongia soli]
MAQETVSARAEGGSAGRIPAIAVTGITKRYPGVVANNDVSLEFHSGEIHVLLGENGAGKSTLIAMLAGMQQPDSGEILLAGEPVRLASPRTSLDHGIGTVFQHVLLVPSLTVIENLMLGGPWWQRLNKAPALARFTQLSSLLGVSIDPDAQIGRLSLGQQQQVEIMRALWRGEQVLILDEPTSMLTPQGVRDLGDVLKRLRGKGVAIVLITHKMQEAYDFGDRISVLRLGRLVGSIEPERRVSMSQHDVTEEVIHLMFGTRDKVGGEVEVLLGQQRRRANRDIADQPARLIVRHVSTIAERGECPIRDVSFELRPGEILGIAGVDGNGQKHLAEVLAGQRLAAEGEIVIGDWNVTAGGVEARRELGLRYITDERLGEGTVGIFSVATNLVLKEIGRPPLWRNGLTLWDKVNQHARDQIRTYDIRTPSERTPIAKLSGGNIQKALLARELTETASIAIFNKPTYGLDLHNTRLARERIRDGAEKGLATIVISTELDELLELSDRIGVMFQGRLAGIVDNTGQAEREIGLLMTGAAQG